MTNFKEQSTLLKNQALKGLRDRDKAIEDAFTAHLDQVQPYLDAFCRHYGLSFTPERSECFDRKPKYGTGFAFYVRGDGGVVGGNRRLADELPEALIRLLCPKLLEILSKDSLGDGSVSIGDLLQDFSIVLSISQISSTLLPTVMFGEIVANIHDLAWRDAFGAYLVRTGQDYYLESLK